MELSTEELKYLRERKEEIERELEELNKPHIGPHYHDDRERLLDLADELEEIDAELQRADAS